MADIVISFGEVQGLIKNNKGVKATVNVSLQGQCIDPSECVDKTTPSGTIKGTVEVSSIFGLLRKYEFSSNQPSYVTIAYDPSFPHVEAYFKDTVLKDISSGDPVSSCTTLFTGTQVLPNIWLGLFRVSCPDNRKLIIYGYFYGNINISAVV